MKTLYQRTPDGWARAALQNVELLLLDHLQCEMKATSTALMLVSKNPHLHDLVPPMLEVAREEMEHYGLIHQLVVRRGIHPYPIKPSPYMVMVLKSAALGPHKPLLDRLVVGALVEARSCERFRLLERETEDAELKKLFADLVGPEAQHFNLYMDLAGRFFPEKEVDRRFEQLSKIESKVLSELPSAPALHSGWQDLAITTADPISTI